MSSAATESLRSATAELRAGLVRLLPEPNPSAAVNPETLSNLLTKLLRAGECWRRVPRNSAADAELEKAISEYRSTMGQLAEVLPRLHAMLLTEKARLEMARAHVAATEAWARASQNTL
jgi:hypothetical protein